MMELLRSIFGYGKELAVHQMAMRGVAMFFVAWVLLRLSGRRSFGIKMPFDNIISILLGAILSRAVVGASAPLSVVITGTVIVLLHRLLAWFLINNSKVTHIFQGEKVLLFTNAGFIQKNLKKALLSEADVMQGVRKTALTEDLEKIDKIYMECNGEITCIKK